MTTDIAASWRLGTSIPAPGVVAPRARATSRGRRPVLWASLALHAVGIALLLLYGLPAPPADLGEGPPSVSVMLEPSDAPAASRMPTPQAAIGTPDAEVVQRAAPPETVGPLSVPVPLAEAPPPVASEGTPSPPTSLALAQPPVSASPPALPPPPAPAPRLGTAEPTPMSMALAPPAEVQVPTVPPSVAPPRPAPSAELPVPPIPPSVAPSRPAPAPAIREALLVPPVRPPPRPAPVRPSPAPRESSRSGFPMPTFSSLGGALPGSHEAARAPSRQMAGPVKPSTSNAYMPQVDISGDDLGAEYDEAFNRFWRQHRYYPPAAGENGEEGDVGLKLVIARDGKLKSMSLMARSGSVLLDAAAQSAFRDHKLPPLPDNWNADEATRYVNIHFYIIR